MWRSATVFAFGAGAIILAVWLWRYASGALADEFAANALLAWGQLAGEILTAAALIGAGYGLVTNAGWARKFYLVATGMLLFAGLHGLGRHAGSGDTGIVILYLVIGVLAITFAMRVEE
jgi:hypothetical protein